MNLSVVIVNYKHWESLEKCLNSLLLQELPNIEIIVVDNNSNDNEFPEYSVKYPDIKWIQNKSNDGYARGCNIGASGVTSEWVLFLNPDSTIPKGCLSKLMRRAELTQDRIISIKQLDDSGSDTMAYGMFLDWYTINPIFRAIYRFFNRYPNKTSGNTLSPDWVSGSFILMRTENFRKVGGWDERYWMYYDDMDLCKNAQEYGILPLYYNDIYCYHSHGKSSRFNFDIKVLTKTQLYKSRLIYIRKHYIGFYAYFLCFLMGCSILPFLVITCPFVKHNRKVLANIIRMS